MVCIVTEPYLGGGWACWKFYEGRKASAAYEGRGPDNPNTLICDQIKLSFSGNREVMANLKTNLIK